MIRESAGSANESAPHEGGALELEARMCGRVMGSLVL